MRPPWRRRARAGTSEADQAIRISEQRRDQAKEQRQEFERLATRIRRMRERNHLAEAFRRAMEDGR
ncbi:DUF7620 family protein [Actinomadura litoris]|uniref:DUF7620 family protein n=1 Tax=Actinomadura litoris TaxID=2678616 RepID=UPI001FA6CCA6|nr:hypothetical protein [Actinomadura litoris]